MREIEVKARVADKKLLLNTLDQGGITLTAPITQRDRVYGLVGVDGQSDNSAPWLRVREQTRADETTTIFTLKRSVTNQLDSIEHETVVENTEELIKIISNLEFAPYSDLKKTRQIGHYDGIEICVDTVSDLGDFIEVEKITEEDVDYDAVIEELWSVLERFGVDRSDEVTDGYDVLMRKSQGLVG